MIASAHLPVGDEAAGGQGAAASAIWLRDRATAARGAESHSLQRCLHTRRERTAVIVIMIVTALRRAMGRELTALLQLHIALLLQRSHTRARRLQVAWAAAALIVSSLSLRRVAVAIVQRRARLTACHMQESTGRLLLSGPARARILLVSAVLHLFAMIVRLAIMLIFVDCT